MDKKERIVRSVCQACHCECGVFVHVLDGKVVKIEGDPDNPMNRGLTCIKGRAQSQVAYLGNHGMPLINPSIWDRPCRSQTL